MKSLEYQDFSARKSFSTVTFIRISFAFVEQVPRLAGNPGPNIWFNLTKNAGHIINALRWLVYVEK